MAEREFSLWNWIRTSSWLRMIPGIGRIHALRPGTNAHIGAIVDAFASFAITDQHMSKQEADIILDLLGSAFPEIDHNWLTRRLKRAVEKPEPLINLATQLKTILDEQGKIAIGLQLYTLVNAAGQRDIGCAHFEKFMRWLGAPEYGRAIVREMNHEEPEGELPFERLRFGGTHSDVALTPGAFQHEFRVYRVGDLVLIYNTGTAPLWVRGRSLEQGSFLRMRERQYILIPQMSLSYEDLFYFFDVARTLNPPAIFLAKSDDGYRAERVRSRQSLLRIQFGLVPEIFPIQSCELFLPHQQSWTLEKPVPCYYHDSLEDGKGFSVSINELRTKAAEAGRRFHITDDSKSFIVSNDPAALTAGGLLLGPNLAPRVVLFIHFNKKSGGTLEIREADGAISVDGFLAKGIVPLRDGSVIKLSGKQFIRCRFSEGFLDEERAQIERISATSISHDFGPENRALENINFELRRGEMLCIMGPSGCGKSTLLSVLSGQLKPNRGKIRLNQVSLYAHREDLAPFIAYMPQEEALSPQLTVREHLRHAITLRRPNLSLAEHERRVDTFIAELGLQAIAHRRVGTRGEKTLSGGERSRLNLGLDLGSRAEIFLFDEPISGLSSKDSEHVTEVLRSLARDKIVIASLHRPGPNVLKMYDKVLLLDTGGHTAFFGTPDDLILYFRNSCEELGINHPLLAEGLPLGADFVFDILETPLNSLSGGLNPTLARRFPPSFWQQRYETQKLVKSLDDASNPSTAQNTTDFSDPESRPVPTKSTRRIRAFFALFATYFQRAFLGKFRNRGSIYSILLEAPILAALVGFTLRSSPKGAYEFGSALHIPAYLFLSATVAMFLGLTNTATEILRDRPILRRERNSQPSAFLYVVAKLSAIVIINAAQCLTYLIIGNFTIEIHHTLIDLWLLLTLTATSGSALALVISSLVKTERAALTAVPLLLVPQMLLAGALVPYREMNRALFTHTGLNRERGGTPIPANLMPLRYCYESLVITQGTRNPFELERKRLQAMLDDFRDGKNTDDQRFELIKEGIRQLLAAGATDSSSAYDLIEKISRLARYGKPAELDTLPIWPESKDPEHETLPVSQFFANERIDLMLQEAEIFRNDYRNTKPRNIFLSPKHYIRQKPVSTVFYNSLILITLILTCSILTSVILNRQSQKTK